MIDDGSARPATRWDGRRARSERGGGLDAGLEHGYGRRRVSWQTTSTGDRPPLSPRRSYARPEAVKLSARQHFYGGVTKDAAVRCSHIGSHDSRPPGVASTGAAAAGGGVVAREGWKRCPAY